MKILIHALGANMGGALRHLTNFLPELGRADTEREYVVLVRETVPRMDIGGNVRVERVQDTSAASWIGRLNFDIRLLPRRLRQEGFSLIVSLTNFGPLWSPVPHVFFQRNPVYYCPLYLDRISGTLKVQTAFRRKLALGSIMRAELVITPSNAMTQMILEKCPQASSREFRTLYHGFSESSMIEPLGHEFANQFDSRPQPWLLFPSHGGVHKGIDIAIETLGKLNNEGFEFTFFTPVSQADEPKNFQMYERRCQEVGIRERVVFLDRIPQRQVGALLQKCDLMLYPSLCESFGFSMVEALAFRLPIVAADTPVNREMCGGGALYYPPLDPAAAAEAVKRALEPEMRRCLIEGGADRFAAFDWSWRRYAREFVDIVKEFD